MEAQRAESYAVVLGLGDQYSARNHFARGDIFPFHFNLRTYDRFEAGSVFLGNDEIELVTGVYLGCRGRYLDFAVGGREQTRNDKVTFDDVVELAHCLAFDQGVCHFDCLHERSGVGVGEFVLDSLDFIVNLDTEDAFDEEHRADDAADAERIGGGITHSHCVDGLGRAGSLLRRCKTGGVGDGTRHDSDKRLHRSVLYVEDGDDDGDVQNYPQNRQPVEKHSALLERREETGAHLQTDGENEEYQTELTNEFKHFGIDDVAEVTHQNAHKKHESDAKRNTCYFQLAQIDTGGDDERVKHQCACQRFVAGAYEID